MNNDQLNQDEMNIELSPDTIFGYLMTTQAYSEEQDDKRKRPLFFWKAYHFYPFVLISDDEDDIEYDDDGEVENAPLAICTEGGNQDTYNFIPMTSNELKEFVRNHPSFRSMEASDIFEALNVM